MYKWKKNLRINKSYQLQLIVYELIVVAGEWVLSL